MRLTIELKQTFGHPDNPRPGSQELISAAMKQLPGVLEKLREPLDGWEICSVKVEGS